MFSVIVWVYITHKHSWMRSQKENCTLLLTFCLLTKCRQASLNVLHHRPNVRNELVFVLPQFKCTKSLQTGFYACVWHLQTTACQPPLCVYVCVCFHVTCILAGETGSAAASVTPGHVMTLAPCAPWHDICMFSYRHTCLVHQHNKAIWHRFPEDFLEMNPLIVLWRSSVSGKQWPPRALTFPPRAKCCC